MLTPFYHGTSMAQCEAIDMTVYTWFYEVLMMIERDKVEMFTLIFVQAVQ